MVLLSFFLPIYKAFLLLNYYCSYIAYKYNVELKSVEKSFTGLDFLYFSDIKKPMKVTNALEIDTFKASRLCVTKLNAFYEEKGVIKSQRAKYEVPLWYCLCAILPSDESRTGMTIANMIEKLKSVGIHVSEVAIRRTLRIMTYLDESIHPHRRNCGVGCYEAVTALGGLRCAGPDPIVYWLGGKSSKISAYRKANKISVKC